jgi:hypothetical protein
VARECGRVLQRGVQAQRSSGGSRLATSWPEATHKRVGSDRRLIDQRINRFVTYGSIRVSMSPASVQVIRCNVTGFGK